MPAATPRLHGKASIGVGGHLNPVDDGEDALMSGLRREWAEELEADWEPEFELIGLLNDDSNPVGAVHLGVVFSVDARGREVDVREHDKLVGGFAGPDELTQQLVDRHGDLVASSWRTRSGSVSRPGSAAERAFGGRRPILSPWFVACSLP